jgi:hypothetical protein
MTLVNSLGVCARWEKRRSSRDLATLGAARTIKGNRDLRSDLQPIASHSATTQPPRAHIVIYVEQRRLSERRQILVKMLQKMLQKRQRATCLKY